MFLKFVLHIAYSNYIFLLSQIKILHIECPYYICLFVWLPPFLPAGTSLSCGCFFAEASKPFRDPRLGFLFAEEFPFPSPGPSSQFFFYAQGTLPLLLCSSQARCLFSPSRVSVRISGLWGEDGSGVFWFILPKRFIFTQADDFSRNSVRFLVLFWSWSRGILLGMRWIPPFSVGIVFFQFLLSPSPVHFPQVVWRSFIKEWDPSVPFALFSRGFFFFFLGDSSGPQAIASFVHRRVAYRRLLLLFGCFPSLEFPVWNKTGFLSSGCASKKDSVQKPTSPFWCFSCPFFSFEGVSPS